ncbi:MAG TPA: methyltransferase domain-containing protein [Rhodopila sp.]|nr:methyltransferase domain-containing protein [Rhodopila sp.]
MDPADLARQLLALQPCLDIADGELLAAYWRFHPRFRFVKTARAGASILDVGAGAGGLPAWKAWLDPQRHDLRLFAADRAPAPQQHGYDSWECLDLDEALPDFPGITFDAALLSHIVEHVRDPALLLAWIGSRLAIGGRIYIEWPSEASVRLPRREALLPFGVDLMISNFFDDATHRRPVTMEELRIALRDAGFRVTASGTIAAGLLGEELLARGLRRDDAFARLAGFWSMTGWCNWVEAVR